MGRSASIDIKFNESYDFEKIISKLISMGWSLNDHGKIVYVDNDDYDWKESDLFQQEMIIANLKTIFNAKKRVALNFLYNGETGGDFIFLDNITILINLNINRKKIATTQHTDFSFYLSNLSPIIDNCNLICHENV